jgi:hypothetical protein
MLTIAMDVDEASLKPAKRGRFAGFYETNSSALPDPRDSRRLLARKRLCTPLAIDVVLAT